MSALSFSPLIWQLERARMRDKCKYILLESILKHNILKSSIMNPCLPDKISNHARKLSVRNKHFFYPLLSSPLLNLCCLEEETKNGTDACGIAQRVYMDISVTDISPFSDANVKDVGFAFIIKMNRWRRLSLK